LLVVSCVCVCVLSGRDLCDELITSPEESYRLWSVVMCDLETSWMRRPWPLGGLSRQKQKKTTNIKVSQITAQRWILQKLLVIFLCALSIRGTVL